MISFLSSLKRGGLGFGTGVQLPPYWDDVLQYTIASIPTVNSENGFTEFDDLKGTVDKTPEQGYCIEGDGIAELEFGITLADTEISYFNGTVTDTFTTDASGNYIIPNGTRIGLMDNETAGVYSNWWHVSEQDFSTLYDAVGGINVIINNYTCGS